MPTPQNGQTPSYNLSATADELFECVWPFCGLVGLAYKELITTGAKINDILLTMLTKLLAWKSIIYKDCGGIFMHYMGQV